MSKRKRKQLNIRSVDYFKKTDTKSVKVFKIMKPKKRDKLKYKISQAKRSPKVQNLKVNKLLLGVKKNQLINLVFKNINKLGSLNKKKTNTILILKRYFNHYILNRKKLLESHIARIKINYSLKYNKFFTYFINKVKHTRHKKVCFKKKLNNIRNNQ
jgi:hypothetical protein